MSTAGILADDLTGALDAGVGFCRTFGPVDFVCDPSDAVAGGSLVLSSGSRDMADENAAVKATLEQFGMLAGRDIAFKKVDSLMRGHVVAEVAAIMRHSGFDHCLFAPAFPAQGRVTVAGRQWLRESDGRLAVLGPDLASAFTAAGFETAVVSVEADWLPEHATIWIGDAADDADLKALAARAAGRGRILYCGTAGLAHAQGGGAPSWPLPLPPPVLAVVGSPHPITRRQVAGLLNGAEPAAISSHIVARAGQATLEAVDIGRRVRLLLPALPHDCATTDAAGWVGRLLATHLPTTSPVGTLLVTGGETLAQTVGAIGARRLRLHGEVEAGLPVSRIAGGPWDGRLLVSKSGAFGDEDTLARLVGPGAEEADWRRRG
ncbi:MAG: four-carbon acid sugar kinase family protein [Azospirillaceae bacterium]